MNDLTSPHPLLELTGTCVPEGWLRVRGSWESWWAARLLHKATRLLQGKDVHLSGPQRHL